MKSPGRVRQSSLWQVPSVGRIAPLAGTEAIKQDNGIASAELPCQTLEQHSLADLPIPPAEWTTSGRRGLRNLFNEIQGCRPLDDRPHNWESVRCWKDLVLVRNANSCQHFDAGD